MLNNLKVDNVQCIIFLTEETGYRIVKLLIKSYWNINKIVNRALKDNLLTIIENILKELEPEVREFKDNNI